MLKIGDDMPDVTLPDQGETTHRLTDLLGENGGVVYFYPKDNTPGCTLEANDFQSLLSEFQTLGLSVTGISKDSVASHSRFCVKHTLSFTLLSDKDGHACEDFGVWQEKKNYGRTYKWLVRTTFLVDATGRVQKVYARVKTKGHAAQVLADARAMQIPPKNGG